jgi:hypothetical protein
VPSFSNVGNWSLFYHLICGQVLRLFVCLFKNNILTLYAVRKMLFFDVLFFYLIILKKLNLNFLLNNL